jgi:hypothetical protein
MALQYYKVRKLSILHASKAFPALLNNGQASRTVLNRRKLPHLKVPSRRLLPHRDIM